MTGAPRRRTTAILGVAAILLLAAGLSIHDEARADRPEDCFRDPELDLGLVIDRSGSMGGDRIVAAKDGAKLLIDDLDGSDQSGLVSYSSFASLDKSLDFDHVATRDAVDDLSAGGSTGTGYAIDESHADIVANARTSAEQIMVLLTDGHTNTGPDPVLEAQEAKDDGIQIYAIGVGSSIDEPELRQIASEPQERYFLHAQTSSDVEQVFDSIREDLYRDDDTPPTVAIDEPQPGHLYLNGQDQGPGTGVYEDRATLAGDMAFQASASDNCYLEDVRLDVPTTAWSYSENATSLTTTPFPASAVAPGNYSLDARALDWVGLSDTAETGLHVPAPAESRVIGLWAGLTTPEHVEYRSEGVHLLDQNANESHRQLNATNTSQGVYVEGLEERGRTSYGQGSVASSGYSEASEVRLLDGLVTARGLVHQANVTWDLQDGSSSVVTEHRRIASLEVAGQPVPIEDETGPQNVSLPGDGYVRLFERDVETTPRGVTYDSNLIHVHAPDVYGGFEIIVGDIHLETPSQEATPQPRSIAEQDDADSGRDATAEDPVPVTSGLYDGTYAPGDLMDVYTVEAEHGEKIKVTMEPAKKVRAAGGTVHVIDGNATTTQPANETQLPPMSIRLYDPAGDLRAESLLPSSPVAQSVELNADLDGTWTVEIEREVGFASGGLMDEDRYAFYSFGLTVTPVPLLPQNDALSGADAPAGCEAPDEAIPEIQDGQWPGVLRDEDFSDVYRFQADIGDLVTATLKPGETTDGVAMDLYLYDEDCHLLDSSSLGGTYTLKGIPEATVQLPADDTGTYYLRVERVNGVGNHHVTLSVRDPMPGLPTNDARTGEDADHDRSNATQAPDIVFQGTLPEGDEGDAYALNMTAGDDAWVVLEMSALSRVDALLTSPSDTIVTPNATLEEGTYAWSFQPEETGEHVLLVEPTSTGGGDYTVSWGQVPTTLLPGPLAQSSGLLGAWTSP